MKRVISFLAAVLCSVVIPVSLSSAQRQPMSYEEQDARWRTLCAPGWRERTIADGHHIANQLGGLSDNFRVGAMACLVPNEPFVLDIGQVAAIVGIDSRQDFRQQMICRLADMLPPDQNPYEVAGLLNGIEGNQRQSAIYCLSDVLVDELSPADVKLLLGPILTDAQPGWNGTLAGYSENDHYISLCRLARKLAGDLTPADASELMGLARNVVRSRILDCLKDKLISSLTWQDVEVLLGPSVNSRGHMINLLGKRTPDGRNKAILDDFFGAFGYSGAFLVDPDPPGFPPPQFAGYPDYPGWLGGQCIAGAQLAFSQVSDENIDLGFNNAARNIPDRAASAGFAIETDSRKARIGALIVWDGGGFGHVGIVTNVRRDVNTGEITEITVRESNWGRRMSALYAPNWGLTEAQAAARTMTANYGRYTTTQLSTDNLDRPAPGSRSPVAYRFSAYVLPDEPNGRNVAGASSDSGANEAGGSPDDSSTFECTEDQKSDARNILEAYNDDRDRINLVADNADYAVLADAAYGKPDALNTAADSGWQPFQNFGLPSSPITGAAVATLYFAEDGRQVLAFRGSRARRDWVTNIAGTLADYETSRVYAQVRDAVAIAEALVAQNSDLVIVGHSLGGRLAQVAALETDTRAVVFNRAPFGDVELQKWPALNSSSRPNLLRFRSPDDWLTGLNPAAEFDIEVSNIVDSSYALSAMRRQFWDYADFAHSIEVLASAMQSVRQVRDSGGLSCLSDTP